MNRRYKNPIYAYTSHILNNRRECGSPEHTMQLLQERRNGKLMNCWESFYKADTTATGSTD